MVDQLYSNKTPVCYQGQSITVGMNINFSVSGCICGHHAKVLSAVGLCLVLLLSSGGLWGHMALSNTLTLVSGFVCIVSPHLCLFYIVPLFAVFKVTHLAP